MVRRLAVGVLVMEVPEFSELHNQIFVKLWISAEPVDHE
jgi:hypothetical protein